MEVKLGDPLPFSPNPFQLYQMPQFHNIPRYLFRLVAPTTAGKTTASEIIPPIADCNEAGHSQDIFRLPVKDAADLLNAHFLWEYEHELKCNLTSWTSSLLFALQYGLFRHVKVDSSSDLDRIFLFIVDTRKFPEGTFVKDMHIINVFRENIDQNLLKWREGDLYFGEYLCQGQLDITGKCAMTSIKNLIENGLFQLCEGLRDKTQWARWAKRVVELRQPFVQGRPATTTHNEIRIAITIAQGCYGDPWTIPMAAMLLALKPRRRGDPVIIEGFQAMFSGK